MSTLTSDPNGVPDPMAEEEAFQTSKECLYYRMVRAAWACSACDGQGHNFVPGACKVCKVCESLRDALLEERGPFMSLHSEPGTKVRFHWGLAGYDGDVKAAREKLTLGAIYTVKALNVYDSSSSVEFREVGGLFNPVQFAPADAPETCERSPWEETAAHFCRNMEYYRGLVDRIGRAIGPEAYTADDGTFSDDVLRAKVPEIIERLLKPTELKASEGRQP